MKAFLQNGKIVERSRGKFSRDGMKMHSKRVGLPGILITRRRYLGRREQFAEDLPEHPLVHERVQRREGHGEQTHEHVGHGEVHDEDVRWGL